MARIIIIGTSGSGKSVLGEQVARRLGVPFLELDTYFWLPGWVQVSKEVFRQKVADAIAAEAWVAGGNYGVARDLIWARADTLVWLDYPLPLTLWRLLRRTIRRIITQEDLWETGNRESWTKQFVSRESLFVWAVNSHKRHAQEYPGLLKQYAHLKVYHFYKPFEAENWLNSLTKRNKYL